MFCLQAVCCKDKFHCCPHGTTCDFVTLTCTSNTTSVRMSDINPPSAKEEQRQHGEVKDSVGKYNSRVPCDSQTSCPDYTTCCLIAKTNKWGCCPLPNVSVTVIYNTEMFICAKHLSSHVKPCSAGCCTCFSGCIIMISHLLRRPCFEFIYSSRYFLVRATQMHSPHWLENRYKVQYCLKICGCFFFVVFLINTFI